ncbi:MAG: Pr6Pr family membrane protein [Treponemataceae bacterium]|nr:Pr6Pr family membrane protein [Treponemataceae bacterium]
MDTISLKRKITSYLLKIIVVVSATVGTVLSAYASRKAFMGGDRVFMYFTIQSNIAIAIICIAGFILMARKKPVSGAWHVVKFVGTVAITLTGVVFGFVLAPTLGPYAWNIQNTLTHLVVPLAAILDFFMISATTGIKRRNALYATIPPLLYAIYAGIGYVKGWQFADGISYPYFFLNWGSPAGAFGFSKEMPFMGTAWWILALLLFLIGIGYLYLVLADLYNRPAKAPVPFDPESQYPVIKSSICTGERVAGFKNKTDGHFTEVMLLRTRADEEKFKKLYNLENIKTEY